MKAVGVTPSLEWRLHGFDLLSEHQPPAGVEWPLMNASWMVGAQYKPAEVSLSFCSATLSSQLPTCDERLGGIHEGT